MSEREIALQAAAHLYIDGIDRALSLLALHRKGEDAFAAAESFGLSRLFAEWVIGKAEELGLVDAEPNQPTKLEEDVMLKMFLRGDGATLARGIKRGVLDADELRDVIENADLPDPNHPDAWPVGRKVRAKVQTLHAGEGSEGFIFEDDHAPVSVRWVTTIGRGRDGVFSDEWLPLDGDGEGGLHPSDALELIPEECEASPTPSHIVDALSMACSEGVFDGMEPGKVLALVRGAEDLLGALNVILEMHRKESSGTVLSKLALSVARVAMDKAEGKDV